MENMTMNLDIEGIGIVFLSPEFAKGIEPGEDYLSSSYMTEDSVQSHIQIGSIVGFSTGTPGRFLLKFHTGYPENDVLMDADYKLRLGIHCVGGVVCVRDLYDLMNWEPECPSEQIYRLQDGYYHITLCSNMPATRILGDNQIIDVYFHPLDQFPELTKDGIPTLCG